MAISTMTLAKAVLVAKAGVAAAAAALALTACGPAPMGAPPAAAPVAPKALAPAAARRLMQAAATSTGTLWGLDFRVSYHETGWKEVRTPKWTEMRRGRLFWHDAKTHREFVDYGWTTDKAYSGDGEVEDLTGARFLYVVPEGRVLVINRVINPGRVSINGYSLEGVAGDDVYFVFGPGEAVVVGFPVGNGPSDWDRSAAKLHGFTADPALLAGAGAGAGAAAIPK